MIALIATGVGAQATREPWGFDPLTRPSADLSPRGEVE